MTMREVSELEAKFLDKMRNLNPVTQEFLLNYMDELEAGKKDLYPPKPFDAYPLKARQEGEPAWKFIQAARELNLSRDEVELMEKAIEEAFEQPAEFSEINLDE